MKNEFELSEPKAGLSAAKQALLNKRLQVKLKAPRSVPPVIPKCPPGLSPLSFSQQQLFFLDQLESGSAAYNFSIAVRLEGCLDIPVLEKSINEIVRRHQSLRTRFVTVGLEPVQQVLPELNLFLQPEDLSCPAEAENRGRLATLVSQEALKPFRLNECPLLRARLFRLSGKGCRGQDYVLVITMPHIITDGWSAAVLYKELASLYEAYSRRLPSPLPELPIQYIDFSYWQRQRLQPDVLANMFSFWKRHLSGLNSDIELPTDRARPPVQTHNGSNYDFFLSKELTERLHQFYRSRNVTLFALLFTAFNVLLHRLSGQRHLCVGTPIANRNLAETETLIGYFVNVLALHTDLSGNPSFTALLERTRQLMLDAQPHLEYPFELLVKKLGKVRDPSINPLFQVMFVLHNVPFESIQVTGLKITPFPIENKISKFDLTLHVTEEANGLFISFEYNVDLFDKDTIERMGNHFQVLLEQIVAAPETRIGELELLMPSEKKQLIRAWNGDADNFLPAAALRKTPDDGFIHHLFEKRARLLPSAIAVSGDGITLSYSELNGKANRLAHYLLSKGLKPGSAVALFMGRRPEMIVGILGVLKAGAAYLPIDPQYPEDEIGYLLEDSGAVLVLTRGSLSAALPDTNRTVVCIDRDWDAIAEQPALNPATIGHADHPAYLIYTSGSTGKPKGVLVSHRNLLHSTEARFSYYQSPVTSFLLLSPFAFDSSVAGIFWTLGQGGKLCIPPDRCRDDPAFLTELIGKERISHLLGLPSFYSVLLEYADPGQLESLQVAIVAGEACLPELAERHYAKLPDTALYNEYGPTEGTVWCTVYRISPNLDEGSIPIGRAVPGAKTYLLDAYLNPVPAGVTGEVYVGGEGVATGYLKQPALTAERFIPDPFDRTPGARLYRTGDRARRRSDGNMLFLGRADHQIKIRGFRVELEQIESGLLKHPAIKTAVVALQETPSGNKSLAAYLVKSPDEPPIAAEDLRAFLKNQLPAYMIPSAFYFVDNFPLTSNGKLDRKALGAMTVPDRSVGRYRAPRNPKEKVLCGIWQQVLGLEKIGVRDNFFEIGGDSILAMQMVSRAKQAGLTVTPRQILYHQTIETLAEAVGCFENVQAEQGPVTGEVPLTPIQRWFFEQSHPNPNHWNQAVLLKVEGDFSPGILTRALQRLIIHHDVLRARYTWRDGGWQQTIRAETTVPVEIAAIDLSKLDEVEARFAALSEHASRWQGRLDLSRGPLIRVVWFDCGPGSNSRLLIIVHHLAIDGVSWRILLEDMHTLYRQALDDREMLLPRKSSSYKLWAERLISYAETDMPKRNIEYWLATDWSRTVSLPRDKAGGANSEATGKILTVTLEPAKTERLLKTAGPAEVKIDEILLAAVATVLGEWLSSDSVLLEMESHGREELFEDVDLSRTLGWFTASFPIAIELPPNRTFFETVASVKRQLAAIPNHGIDYGAVRYLARPSDLADRLKRIPEPQVGFNYLGRIDRGIEIGSRFSLAKESAGRFADPASKRPRLLAIDASIEAGSLHIDWNYSSACHLPETIESLAEGVIGLLEDYASVRPSPAAPKALSTSVGNGKAAALINLEDEAVLDAAIAPNSRCAVSVAASRNILLTGVTGFVGSFLLDELQRSGQGTVYCLVRSSSDQQAAVRIEETLSRYAIHNPQFKHRIVPLSGDLEKPGFGWSEAVFREMAGKIDAIYHNGSSTNLMLPYPALKAVNVSGTSEILRLACIDKVKPVHYVSTLSIFDDGAEPAEPGFSEDDLPALATRLTLGYAQSKLVAEHLLQAAYQRGLPVTVYRLGAVTGHSRSGAWNIGDFHCRFLKLCLKLGMFPNNMNSFMLMPVDFVSRAIAGLSALDSSNGRSYHLFNPRPTPMNVLITWLNRYGYRTEKVAQSKWIGTFSEYVLQCSDPSLQAMAGMVESFVEHDHEDSIPYQGRRTAAALNQIGMDLPAVNESVFVKSLDYLVHSKFLDRPLRQSPSAESNAFH
jgi:fengycin family lipopeptide synthetase B